MTQNGYTIATLNKLPEINSLPIAVRSPFMKALIAEDNAGFTTPEAEAFLQKAIEAEALHNQTK